MQAEDAKTREVRLGLVLNGGVSLAIWIGGVTTEIDAARLASKPAPEDIGKGTVPLYKKILEALDQEVVVDVIAGASAGGINGVLLGAAIFNDKPLEDLRETWIELGDFRRLLRSPSFPNPPSLMQGDDEVLVKLKEVLGQAYKGFEHGPARDLFVYVTATDLFGYTADYVDSTGRSFEERDHRRVFRFEHKGQQEDPPPRERRNVMRDAIWLGDPDAKELLARAARSSSSFPVAFEAHGLDIVDHEQGEEKVHRHWMVDGGILDNQPFNPVLDKIAVLPASGPVKRVVLYVVPYVTEVGSTSNDAPEFATAHDTYAAAGTLPRDLPKLQSLKRIEQEYAEQKVADEARTRLRDSKALKPERLASAAKSLFESYKATRAGAADAVWELWASPTFRPGDGTIAQDPSADARVLAPPPLPRPDVAQANAEEKPPPPWLPANPTWSRNDGTWTWGLAPAERAAAWALMFLGDVEKPVSTDALHEARVCASQLIATVRSAKIALQDAFEQAADQPADAGLLSWLEEHLPFVSKSPSPVKRDPDERARIAYGAIAQQLKDIQTAFVKLDEEIERIGEPELFRVQSLLDYEVVRNAISIQDEQLGSPFDFIFASAGVGNALGHRADTPAKKLAGMKLNHFGGFLKRSWRANDWLWGRLDGVEHVLRAVVDADRLKDISGSGTALAAIAFGCEEDSPASAEEKRLLAKLWAENAEKLRLKEYAGGDPEDQFAKAAEGAYEKKDIDHDRADRCLQLCRRALAARIQLRVLEEDLPRVAETAADDLRSGASQIANGAFWAGRFYKRDRNLFPRDLQKPGVEKSVDLFRELDVGGEKLKDETSTRLAIDVGSQLVAVAAAMAAGDRGGFPAAARGMLATARGLTLASSKVLRLVARIPAVGAALFALLVGLVIWASLSTNTLIGTFVPALALLAVASGVALLTLATSLFERSLTTWPKVLGYVVFAGVPSVFAICTGWPRLKERLASGLDDVGLSLPGFLLKLPTTLETHVGHVPTRVAFWAASAAAAVALLRLAGGPLDWLVARLRKRSRSFGWRRMMITAYRFAIFTALTALAVGFMLERTLHHKKADGTPTTWLDIADERKGTLAVLLIVSVLLFASLVEELVSESPLSRLLQPLSRLLRKIAHR